jgi:hypothetical protein
LKGQEVRERMRHMGEYAIRTEEVPRFGVDTNVPDPAHTSDADDDAETEHGDQGDALAQRYLHGYEVFCWP